MVDHGNQQVTDLGQYLHADPASTGGQRYVRLRDDRDARGEIEQCIYTKGRDALPAGTLPYPLKAWKGLTT